MLPICFGKTALSRARAEEMSGLWSSSSSTLYCLVIEEIRLVTRQEGYTYDECWNDAKIDRSKTSGRGQGEETSRIDASENGLVSFHIWAG